MQVYGTGRKSQKQPTPVVGNNPYGKYQVIYLGGTAYLVQGTSVSTATATGVAVGNKSVLAWNWSQIEAAMQKKFMVPPK